MSITDAENLQKEINAKMPQRILDQIGPDAKPQFAVQLVAGSVKYPNRQDPVSDTDLISDLVFMIETRVHQEWTEQENKLINRAMARLGY